MHQRAKDGESLKGDVDMIPCARRCERPSRFARCGLCIRAVWVRVGEAFRGSSLGADDSVGYVSLGLVEILGHVAALWMFDNAGKDAVNAVAHIREEGFTGSYSFRIQSCETTA